MENTRCHFILISLFPFSLLSIQKADITASLCLVAVWLLTIFAPGLYFPQMATNLAKKKQESDSEKNTTVADGVLSEGAATE